MPLWGNFAQYQLFNLGYIMAKIKMTARQTIRFFDLDFVDNDTPDIASVIMDAAGFNYEVPNAPSTDYQDVRDAIIELMESIDSDIYSDDFTVDFDGGEYRIIADKYIWETYVETIKDTVTECYDLGLDKIPDFVAFSIDWEQTAKNAYSDGYGHTFASYDGEEYETENGNFHIFRVN